MKFIGKLPARFILWWIIDSVCLGNSQQCPFQGRQYAIEVCRYVTEMFASKWCFDSPCLPVAIYKRLRLDTNHTFVRHKPRVPPASVMRTPPPPATSSGRHLMWPNSRYHDCAIILTISHPLNVHQTFRVIIDGCPGYCFLVCGWQWWSCYVAIRNHITIDNDDHSDHIHYARKRSHVNICPVIEALALCLFLLLVERKCLTMFSPLYIDYLNRRKLFKILNQFNWVTVVQVSCVQHCGNEPIVIAKSSNCNWNPMRTLWQLARLPGQHRLGPPVWVVIAHTHTIHSMWITCKWWLRWLLARRSRRPSK